PLSPQILHNRLRSALDRGHKFRWPKYHRIGSPTKDPSLDLAKTGEAQAQFQTALFQLPHFLGRMPALLADISRRRSVETDDDLERLPSGMHAEAVPQSFLDRKFLGTDKAAASVLHGLDARRHKRADVFAQ